MSTPSTVAFHTLGCKLNFSETSSIAKRFEEKGYLAVNYQEEADIYVINTCSVTEFADRKCRKFVRQALKKNERAKIVVIGCYAQLKPKEIAEIPGVDLVLGAAEKFQIVDFVDNLALHGDKQIVHASDIKEANTFEQAFSFGDRTRSFLKVQDGCNYSCSFCTIPLARGKSRSQDVAKVVANAQKIGEMGCKEIVLTGVNIGDFGNGTEVIEGLRPKKEALFIDLIGELDEVTSINRFRISSIEPNLCNDEIINFVANSQRFAHHFHMPLQSGNNKQLAQMRRRYKRELYADRVASIRQTMPDACIGVDVIVGFPGETDEDFLETYQFIKSLDISYLHVFTFSRRQNTPAYEMIDQIPLEKRRKRNEMLRNLSLEKQRQFYTSQLGKERTILYEQSKEEGIMSGYTENYVRCRLPLVPAKINTEEKIVLTTEMIEWPS